MTILNPIRKLLTPPIFAGDEEKTRIAGLLHTVLAVLFATPLILIFNALLVPGNRLISLPVIGILTPTLVALVYFMRRGYVRSVSFITVTLLLTLIGTLAYLSGGQDRPLNIFFTLVIVVAGLLLGGRGAILSAVASAVVIGIMIFGGAARLIVSQTEPPTPLAAWLAYAIGFILIGVLLRLATLSIATTLARARQDELALKELNAALQQRVTIATRELALAAEVGRSLSQVRDLNSLLDDAVERIRQNFDLYYTQIYLVDTTGRTLVMTAGTGTVGVQLKQRNFRLPIGAGSINGTAAATRQDVLVASTAESATFRPNPLLPNTRSELAVPMIVGDQVVGVLDLQSNRPNAFSEDNQQAFDVLAGLLAVSIQNNKLFAETHSVRAELEQQTRRLARTNWEGFLDAVHNQEVVQAAYVAEGSVNASGSLLPKPQVISAPIAVAGETVGSLSLETTRPLSETESQLVNIVAEQVARQIESVRLLAQAEQYRAEAEQTIRRYTREGWTTYTQAQQTVDSFEYNGTDVVPVTQQTPNPKADVVKPITVRGETIGEINLSGLPDMDEQAMQLLEAVTNQLSTHLDNLRLGEQTQDALAQTETLYTITGQLNAANSIAEILATISKVKNANRTTLMTIEANSTGHPETVSIAAYWPTNTASATPIGTRLPLSQFPASQHWIDNPDEPLFYEDMAVDPSLDDFTRQFNLKLGIRGAIYMALRVGNQWVGLIGISWDTPQRFSSSDQQLYRAVGAQAAVVVNNRLLFEQTQKRGERESIINVISQRIQSTSTVESALEAATREIGQLLKAKRALVEIGTRPTNGGSAHS